MATAAVTTCARLTVDERVWYVLGEWSKTHFTIRVSDGAQAWEGQVSADEVEKRANRWDWTPLKYVDAAVEHLREQQEEAKASYQVTEKDARTLQLAWEMKQAGEEGVPLRGLVNLEKTDDPGAVLRLMMDYMHRKRAQLEMELSRKTRAFRNMKEEADKCANQARGFAEEKAHLESDLYQKFAAVLNAKKAKIRELKSQLGDGRPLAIMPAADESDEGEATGNEASGGEDDLEEEEEERNQDRGGSGGRSEEDRGERTEVEGMDRDGGATVMEEDVKPSVNGRGQNGRQADKDEEKGKGRESKEESIERQDDRKPQGNVGSALLGGGSTYTSGPRKRRR
ncbi:DNA-repair protein XRCC4 [Klebsormidium nitens]|uniref:DNA-repair protein XRCC4 n=1 Tax=Klebsormidium nitens TaxID=105231 RepID=A0A1Y1HQH5_KLENI|nr:DNA-repair protein XRCC4 [Klebsormidium nitens]|eukprot:GAQ79241.1 DNA-repair protein XRCC4 [Klebsormidium nitens]